VVKHVFVKALCVSLAAPEAVFSPRVNASGACAFDLPDHTQTFLSCFGRIRRHFALNRHLLRVSLYGKHRAAQFEAWRLFTRIAQNPPIVC
jgi:putative transposase